MKHPMKPRTAGTRYSTTPHRSGSQTTRSLKRFIIYFAIGITIFVLVYFVFVKWVHLNPDHQQHLLLTIAPAHDDTLAPPHPTGPVDVAAVVHADHAVLDEHHPPILHDDAVVHGGAGGGGVVVEKPPTLAAAHPQRQRGGLQLGEGGKGILKQHPRHFHNLQESLSSFPEGHQRRRHPKTFSERVEMANRRQEIIKDHKKDDYRHLSLNNHHDNGGMLKASLHHGGVGGEMEEQKQQHPRRRKPGQQQHMDGGEKNAHGGGGGDFGGMGEGAFEAAGHKPDDNGNSYHHQQQHPRQKKQQKPQHGILGGGDNHHNNNNDHPHPERRANHQVGDGNHHGMPVSEAADILRHNHDEHRRKIEEKAHKEEVAMHKGHKPMNPLEYRRKMRHGGGGVGQQQQHGGGVLNETQIVEERRLQAERLMKVIDARTDGTGDGNDHSEAEMKVHVAIVAKKAEAEAVAAAAKEHDTLQHVSGVASNGLLPTNTIASVAEWESQVEGGAEGLAAARDYFHTHISTNTNRNDKKAMPTVNDVRDDNHNQHETEHNHDDAVTATPTNVAVKPSISEVITRLKAYATQRELTHKANNKDGGSVANDDTAINNNSGGGIERTVIGALVVTVDGPMLWKYHPDVAPRTVANFIRMSAGHHGKEDAVKRTQAAAQLSPEQEFSKMDPVAQKSSSSNSVYFHSCFYRYEQGFVLQGGLHCRQSPPNARGGKNVPLEYSIPNTKYTVALARAGADVKSGGSEFFINLRDNSGTLSKKNKGGYAVFATVVVEHEQTLQTMVRMKKRPVQKGGSTTAFGSPQPTILWIETLFA